MTPVPTMGDALDTTNILGQPLLLWIAAAAVLAVSVLLAAARPPRRRAVDQVAVVGNAAVSWRRRAVLNHNEGLVYASARAVAAQVDPAWKVWPQVSLGEVVETEGRTRADREAHRWINSKRADFLVVDGGGWPLAVIEYQGRGHDQGNAAERDAVKRTVLPRAGIRYIAVPAEMSRRRGQLEAFLRAELRAVAAGR